MRVRDCERCTRKGDVHSKYSYNVYDIIAEESDGGKHMTAYGSYR